MARSAAETVRSGYNDEMNSSDEKYMLRALQLAGGGRGMVEPNPMVGAVIVREGEDDGKILGEGFHRQFGSLHAEVEAISAAKLAGEDLRGATIYVTLEPCSHYGKTPPCAKALIDSGLGRVVVAVQDPDKKVAGQGLDMLREAGLTVELGLCQSAVRQLLSPYIKLRTEQRPWVICKWAQTADGALALPAGNGQWISCETSRDRVHQLRGLCDGILVGAGTAIADDPLLTNRSKSDKKTQPVRVVLDSNLRTPISSQLIRTAGDSPVIIATTTSGIEANTAEAMRQAGAELLELPASQAGVDLTALLDELGKRQWTHLLIEGGAKVLESFVNASLADELQVFLSPQQAGPDENLPRFDIAEVAKTHNYVKVSSEEMGSDTLRIFRKANL